MSLLTGPGRNSEMSVMMSEKESMPDLPTSSRWPGLSILVVEVELDAVDALDLGHGVSHRGLHPDAEDVELEQAEVLHVVLVELAHREAGVGGLDGGAVEQGGVGEQHPARVDGDVAGQPVE